MPKKKAKTTESKIPAIIANALDEFIYASKLDKESEELLILIIETPSAAPSSEKTMATEVEVGSPKVLKASSNRMLVIITVRKINIISEKLNCSG